MGVWYRDYTISCLVLRRSAINKDVVGEVLETISNSFLTQIVGKTVLLYSEVGGLVHSQKEVSELW